MTGQRLTFSCCLLLMFCCYTELRAEIPLYSVPELVSRERDWRNMAGQVMRVEGRYSSFTRTAMQFQKCELFFYLPADVDRPLSRSKTIEVIGKLIDETSGLSFRVESIKMLPSDADLFYLRQRALPANDPQPWYELGEQTVARGKFYDDTLLARQGEEAIRNGLQIEKGRRKNIDSAFLAELSAKAAEMGLSAQVSMGLLHESLRFSWEHRDNDQNFDPLEFRQRLVRELPGANIPLVSLAGKPFDRYREEPVESYANATEPVRRQFGRLFYLEVARAEYQQKLTPGGINGDQVASEFLKLAPDDPETAAGFRQQALMFRTKNLATASRGELLIIAEQYERQNQPEMAQTAQKTWLMAQEKKLGLAGPAEFLQLAIDYDTWLAARLKGEELLLAGIGKFPKDAPLIGQLRRWGFVEKNTLWVRASEQPEKQGTKMEQAVKTGRIIPGMTPDLVISALGGPKTVTRIASADQNLIIWNYPDARLAIQFKQRRERQDYVVSHVGPLRPSVKKWGLN